MDVSMTVVNRPIAELRAYEKNPKAHPEWQIQMLVRSIEEYGWTVPVLVDAEGVVIAGHGRLEAARAMGMDSVPTIAIEGLTDDQVRAYRIADNKLTEVGGWDETTLAEELKALDEAGFDTDLTGIEQTEVDHLLASLADDEEEEPAGPPDEPVTKPGDLWVLGRHRLVCGDSTDGDTVARVLDGEKPNLMVTDPPYGVDYDADWRNRMDRANGTPYGDRAIGKVSNDDTTDWSTAWSISPANVAYCWSPPGSDFVQHDASVRKAGFEPRITIIWTKNVAPIGRGHYHVKHEPCIYAVRKGASADWIGDRKQTTLWEIDKPQKSETGHSTQKPIECMERPIRNHKGDVYEPFAGSGTTIIAAERQRRRCFAIELDPGYCDVIMRRWEKYTGLKAVLET